MFQHRCQHCGLLYFFQGLQEEDIWGGVFLFCFFSPPTVLAADAFKDSSYYRLAGLGFSRTILCCVRVFRPEECVGERVSSHRKQLGIAPTFETSCWQAQAVTSDAFHASPIGGPVLPFGKQDLLSAGRGGQTFQPSVLKRGARFLLPGFAGRQLSYSSCPMPFLLFSLLRL